MTIDTYVLAPSPIGDVYVAFSDIGVSCVVRASQAPRFEQLYLERFGRVARRRSRVPAEIARTLKHGAGAARAPQLAFDLRTLGDFDRRVLMQTLRIPRGETRSYGQLAADVGAPRAARAVGTALSHNPVPLLIPCHRVIRSDGSAGEWGTGGTELKLRLLRNEGVRLSS
jgi:methylated-DNA-[protein]-cysteine S-methyltransferase